MLRLSAHLPRAMTGLLSISMLLGLPAYGADIPAELRIDQVTVYRQGAMVTRTGQVNVPAGEQRLIVRGLPAGVDGRTLRVTVGNASVQLGGVEVGTINEGRFVSDKERELRNRLEQKTDQRAAIQDEIATAETQLKLLDSLAANPVGSGNKAAVDGASLGAVLATVGSSAAAARAKVRDAKLKQRTVDREIETITADLAKVATQQRQSTEVKATVAASAAATVPVSVSYYVEQAGWNWLYEARLDTNKKQLSLRRQGQVRQGSGEEWSNVQLTLTTAQPSEDVATPQLPSQFLDLYVPRPIMPMAAAPRVAQEAKMDNRAEEIVVTRQARVAATQYLVDYQVPGRVSVAADREPRLYPIADDAFDTDLVARVVPNLSRSAYLEATFKYQRDVPIEAGELQLYRDGAFVGTAETEAFLPGAEVRMPFGVDERVRVAVRDEAAQSAERGVISKQVLKETRQRFEITSYHANTIAVEVIDRVPVSKNADVKVEVLKGATEPTARDFNGKAGVYCWTFDAPPQKTVAIRHYYSVRYPRDRELEASEE